MLSLEYLDLISSIAWSLFERVSDFQRKFWLNTPIYWDSKKKQASHRPIKKCIPLLMLSLLQIPLYTFTALTLYWQSIPEKAIPDIPFNGNVLMAYGSVMNFFITWGSLSNFHKRKEWSVCLNVVGERQFHDNNTNKKKNKNQSVSALARIQVLKRPLLDIIADGIFLFFLFLCASGFLFPLVLLGDAVQYVYVLLDLPESIRNQTWPYVRYLLRPAIWGLWTFYTVWTFYAVVGHIFFVILHGCMVIPRVPRLALRNTVSVIPNTMMNLKHSQRPVMQLMEGAYREYRQFQVFIRPANDAMYFVVPNGLAGIGVVSVIGGYATIRGYSMFPLNIYLIFPSVFCMTTVLIGMMVPIACNIYESAVSYKKYWLSRFARREIRQRLSACRPMGIAAGPFGYVERSLPMEMMNTVVDSVCELVMTIE